jgi:hypothetical protein
LPSSLLASSPTKRSNGSSVNTDLLQSGVQLLSLHWVWLRTVILAMLATVRRELLRTGVSTSLRRLFPGSRVNEYGDLRTIIVPLTKLLT